MENNLSHYNRLIPLTTSTQLPLSREIADVTVKSLYKQSCTLLTPNHARLIHDSNETLKQMFRSRA